MKSCYLFFIVLLSLALHLNLVLCKRTKRQIFREQVQPHSGGKIPESAFETDRLLLNRLQKEGIAVPDGIMLEQRNPKVFPYSHNDLRPVFKVTTTSDNRFVGEGGLKLFMSPAVIETTYAIPQITDDRLPHVPIQSTLFQPIYRPFILPNLLSFDGTFQPNNFHTQISNAFTHSSLRYYYEDYVTSRIFNDWLDGLGLR